MGVSLGVKFAGRHRLSLPSCLEGLRRGPPLRTWNDPIAEAEERLERIEQTCRRPGKRLRSVGIEMGQTVVHIGWHFHLDALH